MQTPPHVTFPQYFDQFAKCSNPWSTTFSKYISFQITLFFFQFILFFLVFSHVQIRELTFATQCVYTYFCIRMHDTSRSFEPIFMKFIWLVRVHPWVFLEIIDQTEPWIWVKMCPKTSFSGLSQTVWVFFVEKTWKLYSVPHFPKIMLYSFLSSDALFP